MSLTKQLENLRKVCHRTEGAIRAYKWCKQLLCQGLGCTACRKKVSASLNHEFETLKIIKEDIELIESQR
jgi:hypothetical protein